MKPAKETYVVLCLLILIAIACEPVTAVPTGMTSPLPTNTPIPPTNTSLPEPSPTETLSPVEKEFVIPTMQDDYVDTPTPIATPEFERLAVELKDLSEQDFLDLIYEMNRYSYQNYPSLYGDWWTDSGFVGSQESVALAIQEYLYRFPESPYADRLRWQLAFINSIGYDVLPGNEYDDSWIVSELQKAFDEGTASPNQLENVLDKFWFAIAYVQPIENLFADGKTGMLYVIAPQVWAEEEDDPKSPDYFQHGGLFIVVREVQFDKFQVILLKNAWKFSFSDSSIYEVSDHNQNDVPEIALYIGAHSGTMCGGNLLIYEWKSDTFVELTKSKIQRRDCGEDLEYSVVDNVPAITYHGFMPRRTEQYVWDGEYYRFEGYESTSLMDKWWSAGSFSEEAEAIEALLSPGNIEALSPSQFDFLRFRLGIVYALNSDPAQVKRVLQDLVDHPVDGTRTIYSDFAKNFLRYYSDDKSLLLACRKSRDFFDTVTSSSEVEDELFGISLDFIFGPGLLQCLDQDVFELLTARIPVTVENVPAELRNYGASLYYAEKQDVNLDGITEEWLITFNNGIFVMAPNGNRYEAIHLGNFWYDENAYRYSTVEMNIERWMGIQDPILTVRTDQELSILSIGEGYNSTELGSDFDVKNAVFSSQNMWPEYQVFFRKPKPTEDYYGVPWSGYRWDSDHQKFREDLIEYTLFIERDPEKALDISQVVTPVLMDWRDLDSVDYWLPRYFYLCGLAYELSSETHNAAEIYWQIWHDFPESPYALMARYKLESVSP
jgi:hypothetical protein